MHRIPILSALLVVLPLVSAGVVGSPGAARAQFRGAWLPPARSAQVQTAVSFSSNDTWFCGANLDHCAPGHRGPLSDLVDSETAKTFSVSVKAEASPFRGVAVDAMVPIHRLRYEKVFGPGNALDFESDGVGDTRLGIRAGGVSGAWALSAGYGIEFPTGEFDISATLVPIGQGTRNHELFVEVGRSLYPVNGYVEAGVMRRFRETFEGDGIEIDWGNETHGRLAGGWSPNDTWWFKGELRGFKSADRTVNIPGDPEGQFRSSLEIVPGVAYALGPAWFDVWVTVPLDGRNTPADLSAGVAATYRLSAN